jgi:hypothetical protein
MAARPTGSNGFTSRRAELRIVGSRDASSLGVDAASLPRTVQSTGPRSSGPTSGLGSTCATQPSATEAPLKPSRLEELTKPTSGTWRTCTSCYKAPILLVEVLRGGRDGAEESGFRSRRDWEWPGSGATRRTSRVEPRSSAMAGDPQPSCGCLRRMEGIALPQRSGVGL